MPAEYTHQIIAEKIYEQLPAQLQNKLTNLPEYFLGAQGGDLFYFMRYLCRSKNNPGKFMHNRSVYAFFCALAAELPTAEPAAVSYIAGYITHYAADTVFHPYVYGLTEQFVAEQGSRCRWHAYIESDIDTYFVQKYKGTIGDYRFPVQREEIDVAALQKTLSAALILCGQKGFSRRALRLALCRFYGFERGFLDKKGNRRRLYERAERVLHLPRFLSVLCRREKVDENCLNRGHRIWRNPSDHSFVSNESADDLFARSIAEGVRLVGLFFACTEVGLPLPEEEFDRGFLSGVASRLPHVRPGENKRKK